MGRRAVTVLALSALVTTACGSSSGGQSAAEEPSNIPPLRIAALDTPFETALAHAYATGLGAAGYEVEITDEYATLEEAAPALREGDVDLVPSTVGDALSLLYDTTPPEKADRAFQALKQEASKDGIATLDYTPGIREGTVVMPAELADKYGVAKLSELQKKVPATLTLAGPETCEERRTCYEGLRTVYTVMALEFLPTDDGGEETFRALADGRAEMGWLYTTSEHRFEEEHLVPLEDDMKVTGPGNIVPLASLTVVEVGGEPLVDAAGDLSEELTGEALIEIEEQLHAGEDPAEVGRRWAEENGAG